VIGAGTAGRTVVAVGEEASSERVAALAARGVTVLPCKSRDGRVDIADLARRLAALDITAALVEGGGTLAWAFVAAGLVDRVVTFVAPRLLGGAGAPTPVEGAGLPLAHALELVNLRGRPVGEDWVLEAEVAPRS
jgi:diaminohydroxyphosphoribosylaminopyrimidine deaminase/5-amino-6-(5-phosphoribosylamino)uracil reductase